MRTREKLVSLFMTICLALLPACTVEVPLGAGAGSDEGGPAPDASASADPLAGIDANSRVVALTRSIGDMWLLAGGELVGATEDALDLPDMTSDAVSVGSIAHPSLEQVLALNPDLVLLNDGVPAHKELHAALDGAGVPVLVMDVNSFDDYASQMERLAAATGCSDLFDKNVAQVRGKIDEVVERSFVQDRGTYLVLRVSEREGKVLGAGDFACAMLDDLGMANAVGDKAGSGASMETIAGAAPDWIFVIYQGDSAQAQRGYEKMLASDPAWAELAAVKAGHVVVLPQDLFQYAPNACWADAYAYLSQVLHGAWA